MKSFALYKWRRGCLVKINNFVRMPKEQTTLRLTFVVKPFDSKVGNQSTHLCKLKNKFELHEVPEEKKVWLLIDAIGLDTYAKLEDLCQPEVAYCSEHYKELKKAVQLRDMATTVLSIGDGTPYAQSAKSSVSIHWIY